MIGFADGQLIELPTPKKGHCGKVIDKPPAGHFDNIRTGGKCLVRPGQDYHPDLFVLVGLGQRLTQLTQKHRIQRIQRIGSVEFDEAHMIVNFDD